MQHCTAIRFILYTAKHCPVISCLLPLASHQPSQLSREVNDAVAYSRTTEINRTTDRPTNYWMDWSFNGCVICLSPPSHAAILNPAVSLSWA